METLDYTFFSSDLKSGSDPNNPSLNDFKLLTTGQILHARSILYIRPDGKKIYLKNRSENTASKNKINNRYDLLRKEE
jgi:hypothetical protein